jgi:type II secretion system protein G
MLKRIQGFTLIELLIVVAIIAILAAIAVPNFLEAQTRSKVSRVKSDQRTMSNALEAYYVDNNSYPAQAISTGATGGTNGLTCGVNQLSNASAYAKNMPTFAVKTSYLDPRMTLTTPVAYITSFSADPFADSKGVTWSFGVPAEGIGWLVWSYGPDTDEGTAFVKPTQGPTYTTKQGFTAWKDYGGDLALMQQTADKMIYVETQYYNPNQTVPSPLLVLATYDPSNGTTSNGDVWRKKD